MEGVEEFAAELPSGPWSILVYPHAGHLLALAAGYSAAASAAGAVAPHVPEERAVGMMAGVADGGMLLVVDGRWREMRRAEVLVMGW